MQQDVGIAEWQTVKKQGRDDHIKQSNIQPLHSEKVYVGVVYIM